MAMWVAPIRVYCHHLENIHICYFFSFLYLLGISVVATKNRKGDNTFGTLKRNEWSVMCWPGCKIFLLNPVYSPLEILYRQVVPYLVMLEIQSPISAMRVLILYYIRSVRCKRSARLYLFDVDIIIISLDLISKIFLVIIR